MLVDQIASTMPALRVRYSTSQPSVKAMAVTLGLWPRMSEYR